MNGRGQEDILEKGGREEKDDEWKGEVKEER